MANTKTLAILSQNPKETIYYLTLVCVGNAQETNYVIHNSSTQATTFNMTDPKDCLITGLKTITNVTGAARVQLNWDATTPIVASAINTNNNIDFSFKKVGGLRNQAAATSAAGNTGNITLTTTGLVSGDVLTLLMKVRMA